MNNPGNNRFEAYRQHYKAMYSQPMQDGEVVLWAADWHQFRDPESIAYLEKSDLEQLGIMKGHTRQEIIQCLGKIGNDQNVACPLDFSETYKEAVEFRRKVINLEERKKLSGLSSMEIQNESSAQNKNESKDELIAAFHRAIRQVIEFCEEGNDMDEIQTKLPQDQLGKMEYKDRSESWFDRVIERLVRWWLWSR